MDPQSASRLDEGDELDEIRPTKRQCLASPIESSSVIEREVSDAVMSSITEKDARSEQQDTQMHATSKSEQISAEGQLVAIPGLGNFSDHDESRKSMEIEEPNIVPSSNMPDSRTQKVETDGIQSRVDSGALLDTGTEDVHNTAESSAATSELPLVLSHSNNHTGAGTGLDTPPASQNIKQSLLSQPLQDPQRPTNEKTPTSIPELEEQKETRRLVNDDDATRTEISQAFPTETRTSPIVQPPPTMENDVVLQQHEGLLEAANDEDSETEVPADVPLTNGDSSSTVLSSEQRVLIPLAETDGPSVVNINPHLDAIEASIIDEGAEWESDSSPIESSSSSDVSSVSSSEDDQDGGVEYALLEPEEQARILMQDEAGSDDEGGGRKGGKGGVAPLRTLNERPEEIIPKPNITVTPEMKIEELGKVESTVEDTVVVKAKTSGEYQVLEIGSLLCLEDRTVVGVIAETLGRVQQPLYTIRFANTAAIEDAGLSGSGTTVYFVKDHSTFVFTNPLRSVKGTDASNFHDEEVGEDEMEFSDDEKEAEHKRQVKLQKQAKKGLRSDGKTFGRGPRRPNAFSDGIARDVPSTDVREINYDDVDTTNDGYTPLQRPSNYQEMVNGTEETFEDVSPAQSSPNGRDHRAQNGRGRGARGERGGRGRGGREPHRKGSFPPRQHSGSSNMGPPPPYNHQKPTRGPGNLSQWQHSPVQMQFPPPSAFPPNASQLPQTPALIPQSSAVPFSPSPISPLPSQSFSFPNGNYFQQPQQQQSPQIPPPGSYINPAFFNVGRSEQMQPGGPNGNGNGSGNGNGNWAENAESYRQVNELLASLNAANQQGAPHR